MTYFSKKSFTDSICAAGLELISRLRDDADLLYIYNGPQGTGRGRPKKYDGKVRFDDLREAISPVSGATGNRNCTMAPFGRSP